MHSTSSSKCELRSPWSRAYSTRFMSVSIASKFKRWIFPAVLVGVLCLASWFVWKRYLRPWLYPPSPLVMTPQLALESLQATKLYFNRLAYPWLLKQRPDLLTPEDHDESGPRVRAFRQAPQDPKLFRQLDRQVRFDTLLLLDDPSNYQRLLDHLLEPEPDKRDFRLVYLDHWAFVFKRGAEREWQPSDADPLKKRLSSVSSDQRAAFLAKCARRMLAIRRLEPAKQWLDEAISTDSSSIDALAGMASYYVEQGKWPEAESFADRALEIDGKFAPALQAKVVALRATDQKADAFRYSEKLNGLVPESPVRLFQHAQVAHEAREFDKEIAALERLIQLASAEQRPTGEYEFHLGEAHVFQAINDATHAPRAIAHLKNALRDPALPSDKRRFAEERIATIRERTGLK
jgi:tetratricopeptide (TPR) repeat protein